MDIQSISHSLGLNEKETKVYLAVLELGTATIQDVSKQTGVKRTSIYNFIDELKMRGLVSEITQDHRTFLLAEHPDNLIKEIERQQREAEMEKQKIQALMPELLGLFNRPGHKPKVKFYDGVAGIKKVYENTLTEGGPIHAFSDYEKMLPVMDLNYMVDYANRRAEKGIHFYSIGTPGPWAKKAIELNKKQKREMKVTDELNFSTEINIYGNKVALISFTRPYAAIIVEDKAIADTLLTLWKWMWKRL